MKSVSIKTRLLRMQLILATSIIAVVSTAFLINDVLFFKNFVLRQFSATAKILERNLTPTLTFLDKAEAEKILSSLQTEPSVLNAIFFDSNREAFATYSKPGTREIHVDLKDHCKNHGIVHRTHYTFLYQFGEETNGRLCMEVDLKVYAAGFRSYIVVFLMVLILSLILAVVLAYWIQRALSGPISRLAQTTRNISESGDYSLRMATGGFGDSIVEINTFSTEFNKMLDQIQARDENIRHEKETAENANHAKSVFLANISHELRTPMHGIMSFARFGQQKIETADKEKLKSYFDEISDSGSRLMNLLNDLLDLSKLEAGKATYTMQKDNFNGVLKAVQSEMGAFAEEKGLSLSLMNKAAEVEAVFDAEKMMQVLRNIVSNAVKFSEKGSAIDILLEASPTTLRCSVSNRGVGIPKSELKTIFEKFIQSSTTRTGAGGTGLGLAICREIIRHHGGEIWAESEPNVMTKFVFEFPRFAK